VNDPDATTSFPVVEFSSEPNGTSRRDAFLAEDTIIPPGDTIKSHTTVAANVNQARFEPTVFGAVRRYRVLVITMAILAAVLAAAYSLHKPKIYQAEANVTVPLPVSLQTSTDPGQYFDSQALLLESQGVAQQAANIANAELGNNLLDVQDFYGKHSSLLVSPPTTATPGAYGATIVAVSFRGSSAEIAQLGLNAVIQAFDEAVSNAIRAQTNATVAAIDKAINQSKSPVQQAALETQRTQVLVNEQSDLAQAPTAVIGPATRANGKWAVDGAIGLVAGLLVGVALAYALAVRRRRIADRQDPAVIYDVPMMAEIPAFKAKRDPLPMADDPDSAAAEAFRFAAVSVERIHAARGPLSLALVSPVGRVGKSTLVANLALAIAEGGTRLLVVDADPADDGVTAILLPGIQISEGFEQVLSGRRAPAACLKRSPFNDAITVLGSSPSTPRLVTGAARLRAARALFTQYRKSFDIVLIDCPALLRVADATEMVNAADAAIVVVNPDDQIPDHLEMADWLTQGSSCVIGYLYSRVQMPCADARQGRGGSVARPVVPQVHPNGDGVRPPDDGRRPSQQPQG
jgi:Mrp family chromosome partitioning ATPase